MPELPEVQTIADQLAPLVRGRRVRALQILDPKLQLMIPDPRAAAGRTIRDVRRVGKQVVFVFENHGRGRPCHALAVHLRMTGRLIFASGNMQPATGNRQHATHLRARLVLDRGAILFYDVRRFGTLRLILHPDELATGGGLDPLDPACTPAALGALLAASRQAIKPWLLRQDRLVGIGNIYAAEILHAARLSPFREAGALTPAEVRRLHKATIKILRWGIECGGTTISDFQDARGASGGFQKMLKVYGRAGRPCPRCGAPVLRILQQGRGTFHCAACQREKP